MFYAASDFIQLEINTIASHVALMPTAKLKPKVCKAGVLDSVSVPSDKIVLHALKHNVIHKFCCSFACSTKKMP